ncbi:sugar ABC transporter substrate-binding protein [Amaricoccus solimangrovi]|uniref:Sugar ABC transporter substrate-binding protein n=1 Tax=Amaricoccus solimangrovi TaxID=2589815 RepID=A0A501WHD6_9RHOB|nr:sugar ABC transporter substrate-binding protein [Amaricoccus solimangrovi]TPE46487.1 sugar ABC transporter substrate-binding protein [Amaricoccus solimangrovi]
MTLTKRIAAALMTTAALGAATAAMAAEGAKIFVVGGKADDPFFAVIKKGVDDAGLAVSQNGGSVSFLQLQTYDNIGADAGNLVRTAISQGANGIAVPNWVPESEDEAIKAAVSAGIPVMLYNSGGVDKANELGAINYIGSDESLAGQAGGKYLAEHGATNVICVNTVPGAANLEARCAGVIKGMSDGGGAAKQLPLPATSFGNPTAVAEAIKAALLKDPAVDGIVTVSQADADAAANGIMQAGATGRVKLGGFDMNQTILDRIAHGDQMFAIDQQPYLQGFLATSVLFSHAAFGTQVPTNPILTGPAIVDSSNVEQTMAGLKQGAR